VLNNDQHVLFYILNDHHNNHMYNLRPRWHELTLAIKGDARNFFERQLFKDTSGYIAIVDCIFAIIFTAHCYRIRFISSFISSMYGCVLSAEFYTLNWTELMRNSIDLFFWWMWLCAHTPLEISASLCVLIVFHVTVLLDCLHTGMFLELSFFEVVCCTVCVSLSKL